MVDGTGMEAAMAAMGLAGAAVLALAGAGWLALTMEVHWRQVHDGPQPGVATRGVLRMLGALALLASLLLCLMSDRASMAVLVWVMLLAVGVVSVALMLAWRPEGLRVLWPGPRTAHARGA